MGSGEPMRFTRTFLLRLYVDPDLQGRLCGELRLVETGDVIPFKNETRLVELLQALSISTGERHPAASIQSSNHRE
jgi:hypothetical protein